MGIFGPPGASSLGEEVAGLPPQLRVSTGANRPPIRRASKSLPSSPMQAHHLVQGAGGGGLSPQYIDDASLEHHLQDLLSERDRRRLLASSYAGSAHSRSHSTQSFSRPPSPAHLVPLPPSRPVSPPHSRSSSRTRFTGRIELPLTPTSTTSVGGAAGMGDQQQQLVKRVIELERAYQELAKAYGELEREKEQWRMLASPLVAAGGGGGGRRSDSVSPHRYPSPVSSRPPSPAQGTHPLQHARGHAHSQSWSSLSSFAEHGAPIHRPATTLGRPPSRTGLGGQLTMSTTSAQGVVRPCSTAARFY
ncbi:hypothetical protein JCM8547_004928 [Rhodosporidiobolus lusitaniae]